MTAEPLECRFTASLNTAIQNKAITAMIKLAMALLAVCCINWAYAFGLFPRHHHDASSGVPERSSMPELGNSIPPVPEPETYLYTLVGAGHVAWIIHSKRK